MRQLAAALLAAAIGLVAQDKPFNGKDFGGWRFRGPAERSKWKVGRASLDPSDPHKLVVGDDGEEMVNAESRGVDVYTEAAWGDCTIELEVLVPKGSHSGIYVMGEYEVQILDSFGKEKVGQGDMGGIYPAAAPRVNASRAPGEWQRFVIEFRAPRFGADGRRTGPAKFVKVELNGKVIHENLEVKGPTPGGLTGKETPKGPILLQGDHGPISYRNLRVSSVP